MKVWVYCDIRTNTAFPDCLGRDEADLRKISIDKYGRDWFGKHVVPREAEVNNAKTFMFAGHEVLDASGQKDWVFEWVK